MKHFDVLIAGGGYAGVMCALRLAGRNREICIGLVNPRPHFVERLRLHEGVVPSGDRPRRSFDLEAFLGSRGIVFVQGTVERLDRAAWSACVRLTSGEAIEIGYERFVAAAGSFNRTAGIPGAAEHAFVMEPEGERGAAALRQRLARLEEPEVLVIGGGATGIELAAEIAIRKDARVTLVSAGGFAEFSPKAVHKRIARELDRAGVKVLTGVSISALSETAATTEEGAEIPFDLCALCVGFDVPAFLRESGLEVDRSGRLVTDRHLRSRVDLRVYVAGDCCLPDRPVGAPPRMSVMYALATGAHVADTIADDLRGRAARPFGFWTYGQAIGLGCSAVGYNTIPHDRPVPPYFTGRAAFRLRAFFIWLLFSLLKVERRMPGLPFWLGRPWRRAPLKGGSACDRVVTQHQ